MFLRYIKKTNRVNYFAGAYITNTNGVTIIYGTICKHYHGQFRVYVINDITFVKNTDYIKIIMYGQYPPNILLITPSERIRINYEFDEDRCKKLAEYDSKCLKCNFTGAHHDLLRNLRSI